MTIQSPPIEATAMPSTTTDRLSELVLDLSRRIAFLAIVMTLASWGLIFKGLSEWVTTAVAAAFGLADVGLCCAWAALLLVRRDRAIRRTAVWTMIVCGVLVASSIPLMGVTRISYLRAMMTTPPSQEQPTPPSPRIRR